MNISRENKVSIFNENKKDSSKRLLIHLGWGTGKG
jgi:hypothetical protein